MRVLGIDPGVATIGFGVIDSEPGHQTLIACGVITTPPNHSLAYRLDKLYGDLEGLIFTNKPDAVAVEELFFNTNLTTGISVAHGRGVILLAAYRAGTEVFEYTPLQVKQAVTGYGRADKKQVTAMVCRLLNLKTAPKPDDAADALAVALCHARGSVLLSRARGGSSCSTI